MYSCIKRLVCDGYMNSVENAENSSSERSNEMSVVGMHWERAHSCKDDVGAGISCDRGATLSRPRSMNGKQDSAAGRTWHTGRVCVRTQPLVHSLSQPYKGSFSMLAKESECLL